MIKNIMGPRPKDLFKVLIEIRDLLKDLTNAIRCTGPAVVLTEDSKKELDGQKKTGGCCKSKCEKSSCSDAN